ncbi:hypothetical protein PoB_000999200 [Plakobranchus ocellatus]|uniref:Uncharacterized protein n=1 Tax=Plakobranchus ocellatus TaxID=259542 RepID=A0AAV3YM62_9GAST|nr:hypothetical protein PoB_000999200 [Plakobranchus ocellatus]
MALERKVEGVEVKGEEEEEDMEEGEENGKERREGGGGGKGQEKEVEEEMDEDGDDKAEGEEELARSEILSRYALGNRGSNLEVSGECRISHSQAKPQPVVEWAREHQVCSAVSGSKPGSAFRVETGRLDLTTRHNIDSSRYVMIARGQTS